MMEISLNITDGPKLEIAEVHDTVDYQRQSFLGGKAIRDKFVRKLYKGSLYDLGTWKGLTTYHILVLYIRLKVPTWVDLDAERQATVKAELADKGSMQRQYEKTRHVSICDRHCAASCNLSQRLHKEWEIGQVLGTNDSQEGCTTCLPSCGRARCFICGGSDQVIRMILR